jgi:ABC-type transport system involved in cytochrome c biogenesis permease subunit
LPGSSSPRYRSWPSARSAARAAPALGYLLFALGFGGQIAAFIIRGILAQRIPLANLYESMAAASLLCSLVAVIGE